jgi:tRNA nucleotidyltransferase (CCA-adding enzyme)
MKTYVVGGAIRDELLGLPVQDRDHVVVGATPAELIALGYKPVGRDFPVFLHPKTGEEYALARTERKSGHGYHGFVFHAEADVTLEQDLARRDLTINAMARGDDGHLVDPCGGQADLKARLLRHVGPAFVEDPVRILRVARFAARFADFAVAPDTHQLMCRMVADGEVDHLVAERVWQEFAKGLMEARPSRMLGVLRDCGALAKLLPEVDALFGVPQRPDFHPEGDAGVHLMLVVDAAAERGYPLAVRFAALLHDLGKATTPPELLPRHRGHELRGLPLVEAVSERLRVPADCRELALLACRLHGDLHCPQADGLAGAERLLSVLEQADALRRPERFEALLQVCVADYFGRSGPRTAYRALDFWKSLAAEVAAVDAGAIAKDCADGNLIRARIRAARLAAVSDWLARQVLPTDT